MSSDLYEDLQISKGASPEEVKPAYRKLARQLQHDKNADEQVSVPRIESSARDRQDCNLLLFESARQGLAPDIVKAVRLGARVQWRNPGSDGRTALHVAARG